MATMAIDVVDLNWRLLQGQEKPCSRKGWRRLHCNLRRARGDRCNHRDKRGEGSRITALERVTSHDIEQELDEANDDSDILMSESRDDYGEYEADRVVADLSELDSGAQVRAVLIHIETQQRRTKERFGGTSAICTRRRFLRDFIEYLEGHPARTADPRSAKLLEDCQLELAELETVLYAA